jgi:hypothetical protein
MHHPLVAITPRGEGDPAWGFNGSRMHRAQKKALPL